MLASLMFLFHPSDIDVMRIFWLRGTTWLLVTPEFSVYDTVDGFNSQNGRTQESDAAGVNEMFTFCLVRRC